MPTLLSPLVQGSSSPSPSAGGSERSFLLSLSAVGDPVPA